MNTFSDEQKIKRLTTKYKELFPVNASKEDLTIIKTKMADNVEKKGDFDRVALIISPYDWLRPSFLYMFMSLGKYRSNFIANGYDFLDIYLGNNEEIPSTSSINVDVIATYLGYGEFENKRQDDILFQIANSQLSKNGIFWLYFKGTEQLFSAKYPMLYGLLKERVVNLTKQTSSTRSVREDILL